jgi:hypothetical protein
VSTGCGTRMIGLPLRALVRSFRAVTQSAITEACGGDASYRLAIAEDRPGDLAGLALVAVFLAAADNHCVWQDVMAAACGADFAVRGGHAASSGLCSLTTFEPGPWPRAWCADRDCAAQAANSIICSSVR